MLNGRPTLGTPGLIGLEGRCAGGHHLDHVTVVEEILVRVCHSFHCTCKGALYMHVTVKCCAGIMRHLRANTSERAPIQRCRKSTLSLLRGRHKNNAGALCWKM